MRSVLVTGGAGYVGSHTLVELVQGGYCPVILDNLSNGSPVVVGRIEQITGIRPPLVAGDILDRNLLRNLFAEYQPEAVIHFAGLKAVGESVAHPLRYYQNNVAGTATLCEAMSEAGVRQLVFSSSATVYSDSCPLPLKEGSPLGAANPYGRSKLVVEEMLRDLHTSDPRWRIALLRYFNPIGAHPSGLIGEDPKGTPNNLFPFVTQVAVGRREKLFVYGNDYATHDGTGVRDYIHVVDLAVGHLNALEYLASMPGLLTCNLGTGQGYSVLDMVRSFERVTGVSIPYEVAPRRPGDIDACWADPGLAEETLSWRAERTLDDMCADGWRWQRNNPGGYPKESI